MPLDWAKMRALRAEHRYDYRAIIGLLTVVATSAVELAERLHLLPPAIQPLVKTVGPWGLFVLLILGGAAAAQGKPVVPERPATSTPEDA